MADEATSTQAKQLFDEMIANGQKLLNVEARCEEVEIQAVQHLTKGQITPAQRDQYLALASEIRRLANRHFAAETLFPRR